MHQEPPVRRPARAALVLVVSVASMACAAPELGIEEFDEEMRRYAIAQEQYHTWSGHYATQADIDTASMWRHDRRPGFTIELVTATTAGHSARVTHERMPDVVCGVRVGRAPPPIPRADSLGLSNCVKRRND